MVVPNKNAIMRHDNIDGVGPLNFQGEAHTDPLSKANYIIIFHKWDTRTNIIMALAFLNNSHASPVL